MDIQLKVVNMRVEKMVGRREILSWKFAEMDSCIRTLSHEGTRKWRLNPVPSPNMRRAIVLGCKNTRNQGRRKHQKLG